MPGAAGIGHRATVALDQFRRLGLVSVEATAEVVVLGSRITAITVALTPASAARVQAAQAAAAAAPAAAQAAAPPRPPGLPRTGGAPMPAATPE